jgi:hypothetical protein
VARPPAIQPRCDAESDQTVDPLPSEPGNPFLGARERLDVTAMTPEQFREFQKCVRTREIVRLDADQRFGVVDAARGLVPELNGLLDAGRPARECTGG